MKIPVIGEGGLPAKPAINYFQKNINAFI